MTNLVKKVWWRTPNFITNSVVKYGEDTTRLFLKQQFSLSKNKVAFAKLCFGHHLKESSPAFHSELFNLLSQEGNTGVAAPRGFAKSTILMIDDVFDIVNITVTISLKSLILTLNPSNTLTPYSMS
jgi:hypothetical protein